MIAHRRLSGSSSETISGVRVLRLPAPKMMSWATYYSVRRLADRFQPDLIMERYYNFAGAGMLYAHQRALPSVLEVNALMIDPRGSLKESLDRLLFRGGLRRWAVRQCEWATKIVTPLATTVPRSIMPEKVFEISWGANVDLFDPATRTGRQAELNTLRATLGIPAGSPVVAFSGSFRKWHGVLEFVEAAAALHHRHPDLVFLMIGTGPLHAEVRRIIDQKGISNSFRLTGAVDYTQMPLYLSLASTGVAPFKTASYRPLQEAGFYWSPLKIFEYMAIGLPVVTIDVKPLNEMVRDGEEGLVYPEGNTDRLASAVEKLINDPDMAWRLGENARRRVVEHYSWKRHCERLDGLFGEMLGQR